MTPQEAADLAARTLDVLNDFASKHSDDMTIRADRERVASDLAGIERATLLMAQAHEVGRGWTPWEIEAQDRAAGLIRTAALYGVMP